MRLKGGHFFFYFSFEVGQNVTIKEDVECSSRASMSQKSHFCVDILTIVSNGLWPIHHSRRTDPFQWGSHGRRLYRKQHTASFPSCHRVHGPSACRWRGGQGRKIIGFYTAVSGKQCYGHTERRRVCAVNLQSSFWTQRDRCRPTSKEFQKTILLPSIKLDGLILSRLWWTCFSWDPTWAWLT